MKDISLKALNKHTSLYWIKGAINLSTSIHQSNVSRTQKKLIDLRKKLSKEQETASKASKEILQTKKSITKNTSPSTLRSKLSKIDRLSISLEKANKEMSTLNKKISDEEQKLLKFEERLFTEQQKEAAKLAKIIQERDRNFSGQQDKIQLELDLLKQKTASLIEKNPELHEKNHYDVFISHASEDKENLVTELSNELENLGLRVFEDVKVFKIGDSISKTINEGILNSKFGIIVLSPDFIKKAWTVYEFTGFLMREVNEGNKVILPIWHNISKEEVTQFNPTLTDKFSLDTSFYSIKQMAEMIAEIAKPIEAFSGEAK